jgi:DNA-binding transcriptional MerR regulator
MLISEFARQTGLSIDTVRFYVRKGLITPEDGVKGGKNPYQIFNEEHVQAARLIRLAQTLGFTLREISSLAAEYNRAGMSLPRRIEIMTVQLARIDEKAKQISAVRRYVRAKLSWMENGEIGPEPRFKGVSCGEV